MKTLVTTIGLCFYRYLDGHQTNRNITTGKHGALKRYYSETLFIKFITFLQRDTFLVLKSELHSSDCALWRVDSMSLLQKFTSFLGKTEDGEFILLYKKSTTVWKHLVLTRTIH